MARKRLGVLFRVFIRMIVRSKFSVAAVGLHSYNPHLPQGVSPLDVQVHMERMLASDPFLHSERLKKLLRYLVIQILCGKTDQIKEYSIATEVFGRKDSFDPGIDPIVRVEAHRLRAKLQTYTERHSASDRLVLDLPKGAYVLRIREASPKNNPLPWSTHMQGRISMGVLPLVDLRTNRVEADIVTDSLTEELIHSLMGEPDLLVAPWTSVAQFKNRGIGIHQIAKQLQVKMLLEGSIRQIKDRAHVRIRIIDTESGFSRRLGTYEREMDHFLADHRELADTVTSDLKFFLVRQNRELSAVAQP
jgi:adenylate cyclase